MERYIKNISEEISEDLIKIRRDLHKIPEMADEEFKTSNLILNFGNFYNINKRRDIK